MSKDVKVFLEYAGIILLILEDLEGLLAMLDIFWIGRYKICNIELNTYWFFSLPYRYFRYCTMVLLLLDTKKVHS